VCIDEDDGVPDQFAFTESLNKVYVNH
jgi:hypothetical protein